MRTGAMTLWIGGREQADRARRADRGPGLRGGRAVSSTRFEPSGPLRGRLRAAARTSRSRTARRCSAPWPTSRSRSATTCDSADTHSTLTALLSLGAGVDESGDQLTMRGVGLRAALEATGGAHRRGQLGHAAAAAAGLAGRAGRGAGGRWTATSRSAAGPVDRVVEPLRADGRPGRGAGWPLHPAHRQRRRAAGHRLQAAGGQRPGEVVRADRRDAGRRARPRSPRAA